MRLRKLQYRGFVIEFRPKPIPYFSYDWDACPLDDIDWPDGYILCGKSPGEMILEIDEAWEAR